MIMTREIYRILGALLVTIVVLNVRLHTQDNPYREDGWAKLPEGRKLGQTSAIGIDPDGAIWIFERCGANSCAGSNLAPIIKFDSSGKYLRSFGAGSYFLTASTSTKKTMSGSPTVTAKTAKATRS
jgi:hypothetical protein